MKGNLKEIDQKKKVLPKPEIHLSLIRPNSWKSYDIETLSKNTKNFSGAEIRQSIVEGMHHAFDEKREFTTLDVYLGTQQIIPLAQLDKERIELLQNWALSGKIRLASKLF